MHRIQKLIMNLLEENDTLPFSLRAIGKKIGGEFASTVKYHISILEKQGLVRIEKESNTISLVVQPDDVSGQFVSLPYMGYANCGIARAYADGHVEGYMRISPTLLPQNEDIKSLFVLRARGTSMNDTDVYGKNIENGDYIIIQETNQLKNGDCVVSIVDEKANIKRYYSDGSVITLISESKEDFPPIVIDERNESFEIVGKVVRVIKNPPNITTQ